MRPTEASAGIAHGVPAPTRQSLEAFNRHLTLHGVYDAVASPAGFVFARFALSLGIAKEQMGYIIAVVNLACLMQVAGVFLTNIIRQKKRFVVGMEIVEPFLWIAGVFFALVAPPAWRLIALFIAAALPAAIMHLIRPTMEEWLASLIPPSLRGRFIGRRLQYFNIVVIAVLLGAGFLVERIAPDDSWLLALFLAAAGLFGLLAALALKRASLPAATAQDVVKFKDLSSLFFYRPFIRFLFGATVYNFPINMAAAYYQVFYLKVLGMTESSIAFLMLGYYLVKLLAFSLLRHWSDRIGPRRLLLFVAPFYVVFYLCFPFAAPSRIWPLFIAWALVGVGDAGYGVAGSAALYAIVPEKQGRKAYFAASSMVGFVFSALAAFLAAKFLVLLQTMNVSIAGTRVDGMYLLFLFSAIACGFCCFYSVRFFPKSSRASSP